MKETELQPKKEYLEITQCRSCSSPELEEILALGEQNIVGFSERGEETVKVPLTLTLCGDCSLLQLKHSTNPDLLWGGDYWYRSGVNETMRGELKDIARITENIVNLEDGDIVVDIGANDGTLLASYTNPSIRRVGFDPAENIAPYFMKKLKKYDFQLFVDYFRKEPFIRHYGKKKAKIITAIAMFYDLEKPNEFLQDIKAILHPEGVFVIQQNYLKGMLEQNAFDNICHEHYEYYSLLSLEPLLERNGLEIFNVTENNINGGSFRTYIRHTGAWANKEDSVALMRAKEQAIGLNHKQTYEDFAERVKQNGRDLVEFLQREKAKGKEIYVYGASTEQRKEIQINGD